MRVACLAIGFLWAASTGAEVLYRLPWPEGRLFMFTQVPGGQITTHFTKATGPVLFLTGEVDKPDRDTAGMEKLKDLVVPNKQVILKEAKHGCLMQRPWFEQCVVAVDAWFKELLKK